MMDCLLHCLPHSLLRPRVQPCCLISGMGQFIPPLVSGMGALVKVHAPKRHCPCSSIIF